MIKSYECKKYFDDTFNENCKKQIDKILEFSICCYRYPFCKHPTIQSHEKLLDEDIKYFKILKNSFLDTLKIHLNKSFEIVYFKHWVYEVEENSKTSGLWHNHINDNKCDRQISGLLYLDKTDIGTEFDEYVISPTMYKWYLWDSNLRHRVIPKVSKNKRYTISTSIGINETN
tara:strand:+ start:704 stop:1222 length:519 start_codon:yes stop_codon:yes gene_type:complete